MSNLIKRPKMPRKFPLSFHSSGKFQKRVNGVLHYFGRWMKVVSGVPTLVDGGGFAEAKAEYEAFIHGGEPTASGLLVKDLCNAFWTFKIHQGKAGARMLIDWRETTDLIVHHFGKNRPVDSLRIEDFTKLYLAMKEHWGPVRLGNAMSRIKSVFKYAVKDGLMRSEPAYGALFTRPEVRKVRKDIFTPAELRALVDAADPQMRAVILLGINCGYGNTDIGRLPVSAVDLADGWATFPRPKTGVERRAKLWPETVAALREVIGDRTDGLVFVSSRGTPLVSPTETGRKDLVTLWFTRLLKATGAYKSGTGFYRLRHTFRTVADGSRDLVACNVVMGHSDGTMGGRYTQGIEDARLVAVSEHVRAWMGFAAMATVT